MARVVALLVLLVFTTAPSASDRLWMSVYPSLSHAPAVIRIQVRIQPDAANRALEVTIDSGDYYRATMIGLEGERAARVHGLEYRSLPPGHYEIRVGLRAGDDKVLAVSREFIEVVP